jgi:hypothetical protein
MTTPIVFAKTGLWCSNVILQEFNGGIHTNDNPPMVRWLTLFLARPRRKGRSRVYFFPRSDARVKRRRRESKKINFIPAISLLNIGQGVRAWPWWVGALAKTRNETSDR